MARALVRLMVLMSVTVMSTVASMLPSGTTLAQSDANNWGERADLLLRRSEISIAQNNGRIYVLGGYPGERITSDAVQVYDVATDSWSLGPALPMPMHHTMAAAAGGKLFIIGGEGGNPVGGQSVFLNLTHVLNEDAGVWEPRADMPTRRSGGGATEIDGKIYVAGGRPPRGGDFAMYDPDTDVWTTLPDVPTARNHLAVNAVGGRVVVAGGRFGGGVGSEMTAIVEIYDPATGSWSSGTPLLAPRAGMASVTGNGCLYAVGGEGNDADPRGIFEENEMFNPMTNTWQRLQPMPLPTHGLTGAAFLNGLVYIPGGAIARGVSGPDVSLKLQVFRADAVCQ
ncbi:MAG: Kelch repeat-containing protein [Chloroflexota bacterium]